MKPLAILLFFTAAFAMAAPLVMADTSKRCEVALEKANGYMDSTPPDFPAAIEAYTTLLQDCPDFDRADEVAQNLSAAYLHSNPPGFDKAITTLESALNAYPKSSHILSFKTVLGMAYLASADHLRPSDPDEAKVRYAKGVDMLSAVERDITDPASRSSVLFDLANAQFNTADYAAASTSYGKLLALKPGDIVAAPALYNQANANLNLAQRATDDDGRHASYTLAADEFRDFIAVYPRDANAPDAKLQLARIDLRLEHPNDAIPLLKELIADSNASVSATAMDELALYDVSLKHYTEALPLLQQYVQKTGASSATDKAYVQIAYILFHEKKDSVGALAAYRAAAAGDNPEAAAAGRQGEMAIASSYLKDDQNQQALAIYESLLEASDTPVREGALYGRAVSLTRLKDTHAASAAAEYAKAFPHAPGAAAVMYALGVQQFHDHDFAGSTDSFEQVASLIDENAAPAAGSDETPRKTAALYWAGESARQALQTQQALSFWEAELKADPDYKQPETGDALLGLASLYAAKGSYSEAAPRLDAAFDHYPNKPAAADTILDIAGQSASAKDMPEAIHLYGRLAALAPKTAAGGIAMLDLGFAYLKLDPPDHQKALKAFQDYQAANPNGPLAAKAALSEGQVYETLTPSAGGSVELNLEHALTAYRRVTKPTAPPELADFAAWRVGAIEGKLGRVDTAIQDLDRVMAQDPHGPQMANFLFEKAHVLQQGHRDAPALVAFRSYLARFPDSANAPAAQFDVAIIEYNLAAAELAPVREARPGPAGDRMRKQIALDFQHAADDFGASLAANSPLVPADTALFYQGWANADAGQPAPAILAFKKLIETQPASPHRMEATARVGILEVESNPTEAIRYLQQYLTAGGRDANGVEARLALGEALEETGDCAKAMPLLQTVIEGTAGAPTIEMAAAATFFQAKCDLARGQRAQARDAFLRITTRFRAVSIWAQRAAVELQRLGKV